MYTELHSLSDAKSPTSRDDQSVDVIAATVGYAALTIPTVYIYRPIKTVSSSCGIADK